MNKKVLMAILGAVGYGLVMTIFYYIAAGLSYWLLPKLADLPNPSLCFFVIAACVAFFNLSKTNSEK